ncbi:MAG: putative Ig domain-containing protein [Schumannella sp.]
MGRRALIIALAAFLVIAVGAVLVWAILSAGAPSSDPGADPTTPPVSTPQPVASGTPDPEVTPTPTTDPAPPVDAAPGPVTALSAKPTPHSVVLRWTPPADEDLDRLVVVQTPGSTPPSSPAQGTVIANLEPFETEASDDSAGLKPGAKYSYGVFAYDAAGASSTAAGVTVTLPAAIVVTPVDVTGTVTQQAADATLTDTGSLAFTAFNAKGTRIAAVLPSSGVTGTMTRVLTEPSGAAPGAVVWTYSVPNSALVSLAEGAKRDEVFVIELRDGSDKVPTTITVTQLGINDAPTASAVAPQAAIAGQEFVFPIPAGTFADPDATDTLALSAGTLPGWLSFSGETLSGSPTGDDTGTTTVTITATDPHGASVSADVVIDVAVPLPEPNQPPVAGTDAVVFDLGVDPLQTTADLLANDTDPDAGPNPLAAIPAAYEWSVNGELAGTYTIDATGHLTLNSGVDADGPLQHLAPGEEATASLTYHITDGPDQAQGQIEITVIGAPADGEYGVTKVLQRVVPEGGRGLGAGAGIRLG